MREKENAERPRDLKKPATDYISFEMNYISSEMNSIHFEITCKKMALKLFFWHFIGESGNVQLGD